MKTTTMGMLGVMVAIWDRPLTDAEIMTLYNNGSGAEIR